jgi:outer membrane receptor protein involved in Fe transport
VVSSQAIEQQGSPNVADILNELPAVGIGSGRTNTNFATIANGVSTINLRNLGSQRTLVLQNGRRIVAGIGGTSAVDVNNIPVDLLERVEIITGGASAVYGSEAVAGVVNFILKNDFEGVRVRAQAGLTDQADNPRQLIGLTGGMNFFDGRGNITLSGQYDRDDGLRSRNRAISRNDVPFRSSFTPQGRFFAGNSNFTYDPAGNLQVGFINGVNGFNRNAERFIAVPLERYLANGLAHFDFTDSISFFAEGSYAKAKSRSRLEPYAFDNSDARLPDGTIRVSRSTTLSSQPSFAMPPLQRAKTPSASPSGSSVFSIVPIGPIANSIAAWPGFEVSFSRTGTGKLITTGARRRNPLHRRPGCVTGYIMLST